MCIILHPQLPKKCEKKMNNIWQIIFGIVSSIGTVVAILFSISAKISSNKSIQDTEIKLIKDLLSQHILADAKVQEQLLTKVEILIGERHGK